MYGIPGYPRGEGEGKKIQPFVPYILDPSSRSVTVPKSKHQYQGGKFKTW